MKNTGIIYKSEDRKPQIVAEFAELLSPLSDEQREALETDILQNGCYSPIIVCENLAIGNTAKPEQPELRANRYRRLIDKRRKSQLCLRY